MSQPTDKRVPAPDATVATDSLSPPPDATQHDAAPESEYPTLANSGGLRGPEEPDHTCRLDESGSTEAVEPPPTEQNFDQTLPLPSISAPPTRGDDRTENLSVPSRGRGDSLLDQTLNEPSQSAPGFASAPTQPGNAGAVRRRAIKDGDTSPLSSSANNTAPPATRSSTQVDSPHERTLQPATEPIGYDDTRARWPLIPGYVILSELGRGGMGVVYKARQTRLNRVVALKMIRAGASAGVEDLRRFKAEAEAVARLQHPHIVQIYEIGEIEGLPFFSLEYIGGGSLHQRLTKDTGMPAREAAALVEMLARAMDYAHKQGIIHRDLKPANIMLARLESAPTASESVFRMADFQPKVTDFGLAKKLEEKDTGHTREGSVLGTPSYMAPEQAQGKTKEMGPLADIYALGAILYDLLASRPPFRGETLMDTLHQVINTDPMPPRHLQPNCPRDLDVICLKCLEKDPKKRYSSASDLADDLRRFLNGEPILARAAPWWEKAGKWAKRRPAAASLLLFALLTIAALLGGSTWYAAEQAEQRRIEEGLHLEAEAAQKQADANAAAEKKERTRADGEARRAELAAFTAVREQARAEARERDARKAVDTLFTRLADERLENVPQLQPLRRALYEDARMYQQRFLRDNRNDPRLKEELAFGERRLGFIQEKLGNPRGAEEAYATALALFEELLNTDANNFEYRLNLGIAADKFGITAQKNQKPEHAGASFDRAVVELTAARQRALDARTHSSLIAGVLAGPLQPAELRWHSIGILVAADTLGRKTEETLYSLADAYLHRANSRQMRFAEEQAPALFFSSHKDCQDALAVSEELQRLQPANPLYQQKLAVARGGLGVSLLTGGDVPNGAKKLDEALALLEPLTKQYPLIAGYGSDLAVVRRNRATVRFQTAPAGEAGDKARQDALADLRITVEALAKLAADFDSVPEYREQLAETYKSLGIIVREMKLAADSLKAWQAGIRVLETLERSAEVREQLGVFHEELARAWLAQVMPRFDEAAQAWQVSVTLFRERVAENPASAGLWRKLLDRHYNRVVVFKAKGRNAEAVKFAAERVAAVEERRTQFRNQPADTAELAEALHQWALLLSERGQTKESGEQLARAVQLQRELVQTVPASVEHRRNLCVYLLAAKDHASVLAAVKEWEQKLNAKAAALHEAAWCLASCVPLTEDAKTVEVYARESVRLLAKAASSGFRAAPFLARKEFDVLRMREDFKSLGIR